MKLDSTFSNFHFYILTVEYFFSIWKAPTTYYYLPCWSYINCFKIDIIKYDKGRKILYYEKIFKYFQYI